MTAARPLNGVYHATLRPWTNSASRIQWFTRQLAAHTRPAARYDPWQRKRHRVRWRGGGRGRFATFRRTWTLICLARDVLGAYGAFEDGTYSERVAVRQQDLCLIPDNIDDVSAAGIPVAYLTAQVLLPGWFSGRQDCSAPAIGGSIGNAVTQLARALGANTPCQVRPIMRKPSSRRRSDSMKSSILLEKLADGVRRITGGYGADIVIDGIGGEVLSEALGALAFEGSLTTLGYSASRKTTIDVTNLIVATGQHRSLNMFLQPQAAVTEAWKVIVSLLKSGAIKPIVAKTFPLPEAAAALRYLVEGRPSAGSSSQHDKL